MIGRRLTGFFALVGLLAAALAPPAATAAPATYAAGAWVLRVKSGSGAPPVGSAPVLADVTYAFGAWTQSGRGAARLKNVPGLTVSTGGSPVLVWGISAQPTGAGCGNAAHWIAAGTVAEGTAAITPTSSVAGDSAHLSSGQCKFNVTASNAYGTSNTAVLTLIPDANAVSLGDNAVNYPGGTFAWAATNPYSIPGFEAGTTPGQRKLLLTPGIDKGTGGLNFADFPFTSEIKLVDADPTKPSVLAALSIGGAGSGSAWITAENLTIDGTTTNDRVTVANSAHVTLRGLTIGQTPASYAPNLMAIKVGPTSTDTLIEQSYIRYHQRAIEDAGTRTTVQDNVFRYFLGQCVYLANTSNSAQILRNICLSPYRFPGDTGDVHFDFAQRADDFGGYEVPQGSGNIQAADTGVAQNDLWENNIFFNADARGSATGFASWRSGQNSKSTNFIWRNNILATSDANGFTISSNGGTSYIVNNIVIKANTGDFTGAPVGAGLEILGPSLNFNGQFPGNWAGTLTVAGNFVGDTHAEGTYATPSLGTNAFYGRATWPAAQWVNGEPRARLESKSFADYQAMTAAEIATWVKDTFRRVDDKGPVRRDTGAWRTGNTVP